MSSMRGGDDGPPPAAGVPLLVSLVARLLAPRSLRESMLGDLAEEFADAVRQQGRAHARRWAWSQLRSADWLRLRRHGGPRKWFGARGHRVASAHGSRDSALPPSSSPHRESPLERHPVETLLFDLKSALRTIRHQPRLTATVIATVAIGIVGAAATLAVIDAVLWQPLPYSESERIVALRADNSDDQISDGPVSIVNLAEWGQLEVFDGAFAVQGYGMTYRGGDHPVNLTGARITPGTLSLLGVAPQQGRAFLEEEGVPGADRVVLISHGLWQTRMNGVDVLGQSMLLDDAEHTIVGILPEDFRMPGEIAIGFRREILLPLAPDPEDWPRIRRAASGYARLAEGVSIGEAQAALDGAFAGQTQLDPESNSGWSVSVRSLQEVVVGPFRTVLMVILGAALLLLALAAINLVNLMLVHGLNRQGELAVRASLGAARPRLLRSLLTEGVVLGLIGGAIGLAGSVYVLGVLKQLTPGSVPRLEEAAMSLRVVLATFTASGAAGLLFGGIPALLTTRHATLGNLVGSERGPTQSRWQRRAIDTAATIQVALAVTLLVGAGLLGRSFAGLMGIDPGFEPDNVINVVAVAIPPTYPDLDARTRFVEATAEAFAALPGVTRVGVTNFLPYSGANTVDGFELRDLPRSRRRSAGYRAIDDGYLLALQIGLMRGRGVTSTDIASRAPVALVNESLAAAHFDGIDPIGQGISRGDPGDPGHQWLEIVGVVADVKHSGPDSVAEPEWYSTYDRDPYRLKSFVIKTDGPAAELILPLRAALAEIDPMMAPIAIQTMDDYLEQYVSGPRFNVATVGTFAGIAVLLAAVGMYGLIANTVARRHREAGIRMALGARGPQLRNRLVAEGLRLAMLGTLVGLGASFPLTWALASLLRGVGPNDMATLVAVAALTLSIAALACYLPARRAATIDPVVALRAD